MSALEVSGQITGQAASMVTVTRVGADGAISRGVIVADGSPGSRRWNELVNRSALGVPPPYDPMPGDAVYQVETGGSSFLVSEANLVGPLRELVNAVLATGDHAPRSNPAA